MDFLGKIIRVKNIGNVILSRELRDEVESLLRNLRCHSFSTCANFPKNVRVRVRGKKCYFF